MGMRNFYAHRPILTWTRSILGGWALLAVLLWGGQVAAAQESEADVWWEVRTANFRLLTNADAERGVEIASRLEEFRGVFARLAPSLELRSPAPTTLYAFRDGASYAPFKSRGESDNARVLGQFIRTRDGNYLTLDASSELADAFTVIYHEYVHFLVTHNFPWVPLWFNEGLAEYYSTFATEGRRAYLGEPVGRHRRLLAREGDFSLDALIEADTSSDTYHDADEVGRFYALSWALVHYLMSGGADELDRTADYFLRLRDGERPARAFEGAFGRYLSDMEDELRTYLQTASFATSKIGLPAASPSAKIRPLPRADVRFHLGDLLLHIGRPDQAEKLFYAALEENPRHAEAHAGLAHVRDISNRWQEAEVLYRDALALGPRRALTFLLYGRHSLLATGASGQELAARSAERARKSLRKAVAADPDFGEAHALLAAAHLAVGGDAEHGLIAIARARELLPHRLDLISAQIELHLKAGQVDTAERVLIRQLEPAAAQEPERLELAREAVERTRLLLAAEAAFADDDAEKGLRLLDLAVASTSDPGLRQRLEEELLRLQALHDPS